ncbi:addiction module antidote protein [Desulfobacula sp.]|uniref:addiction module antidote protein n=1 Tax=Desulfobacula sp. TaxID=2593537 RepID=UPI00260E9FF0|nr:addiction module antidote protein [Desulfobacula sp.]
MKTTERFIQEYITREGTNPFREWFDSLKDVRTRAKMDVRIGRKMMATVNYQEGLLKRLQDPEYASEYLNEALKEGSQEMFMLALRDVAKAKGISQVAKETNLNRETMYRMLSEKGNPNLSSLNKLLNTLGLTLSIGRKESAA